MKKLLCLALLVSAGSISANNKPTDNKSGNNSKDIYKKTWIDFNKNGIKDVYEDPSAPIEARIADLLSQMTLEEKTCQMATLYGSGRVLKDAWPTAGWSAEIWKDGIGNIDEQANGLGKFGSEISYPYANSVKNRHTIQRWFVEQTRLGIPVDFTNEGIRGLCHDRATMFPAQCGQGATWNKKLIREIAKVTANEAKALGYTNIYSPILDIAQDPRWGRVVESYGEDPYLAGELGKQMILGLQSEGIVATPKHFAVYSIPVGGRDGGTRTDPHVAPREMKTLYLEPFRKGIQEAGALGVMSSYNDYDGEPVSGSYHFLTEILRQQWGFKGYVVSDSEAVEFLHTKHRITPTEEEMAAQVVNAGLNIRTNFTPPQDFILPLRRAINEGKVSLHTLDQRVGEILRVKFMMGLFDNPYPGDDRRPETVVHNDAHKAVSMKAALESIVLLKNENQMLPLSKNFSKIAVIGPNGEEVKELTCRYGPANASIKTVYQGIKEYLPNSEVRYAKGCDIIDKYFPESELYNVPLDTQEQAMIQEAVEKQLVSVIFSTHLTDELERIADFIGVMENGTLQIEENEVSGVKIEKIGTDDYNPLLGDMPGFKELVSFCRGIYLKSNLRFASYVIAFFQFIFGSVAFWIDSETKFASGFMSGLVVMGIMLQYLGLVTQEGEGTGRRAVPMRVGRLWCLNRWTLWGARMLCVLRSSLCFAVIVLVQSLAVAAITGNGGCMLAVLGIAVDYVVVALLTAIVTLIVC